MGKATQKYEGVGFYYLKRSEDRLDKAGEEITIEVPFVTVCFSLEGPFCRGVAICSEQDQFSRAEGRRIAHSRMLKAQGRAVSDDIIELMDDKDNIVDYINHDCAPSCSFKSAYDVPRTELEKSILAKIKKSKVKATVTA